MNKKVPTSEVQLRHRTFDCTNHICIWYKLRSKCNNACIIQGQNTVNNHIAYPGCSGGSKSSKRDDITGTKVSAAKGREQRSKHSVDLGFC